MSRAKCNLLLAFATVIPLVTLLSSEASAFGHGGFGFHPGFGGYGIPYAGYADPGPAYVAVPNMYDPLRAAKNRDKGKSKGVKLHQHHGWHGTAAIERSIRPPAVLRPASVSAAAVAPPAVACLTKEYLKDRSVLFKDNCTKESASTTGPSAPTTASAPAPAAVSNPTRSKPTQSIRLEPAMLPDDPPQQMDGP